MGVGKKSGPCHYCGEDGPRVGGPEDGLSGPLFVCARCTGLLRDPATAMPLIRGDASIGLRGVLPEAEARKVVDALVEGLMQLKPRG